MLRSLVLFMVFILLLTAPAVHADDWWGGGEAIPDNCGRFTIAPGGGEYLVDNAAGNDYRIHISVWDSVGNPINALPATDIWVDRPGELSTCPVGFSQADDDTDATGHTTISGTIYGGLVTDASGGIDCDATELYAYVMGILINDGQPICVTFDSPDLNGDLAVTVVDFGMFVADYNCTSGCDPCHDYNEDGSTTVVDFGIFAGYYNASVCP